VKDRCFSASRTFGSFKAEGVVFFSTASGVGHGAAHAVFFGLSVIVPAFGPATYYTESCKQMPFFLVAGSPPSFSYLQISLQHQSVICSILCMLLCRKDVVNHALIYVVYGALCECAALTALAFFLIHTFSMVITFNAYTNEERSQQLFVPVMHLGAALLV
jgi:anterior pharynx defective protein 1